MMLRVAWIFGVLSTPDYDVRLRQKRFGKAAIRANQFALQRMERALVEDRIAIVVFAIAISIVLYTIKYAPAFQS